MPVAAAIVTVAAAVVTAGATIYSAVTGAQTAETQLGLQEESVELQREALEAEEEYREEQRKIKITQVGTEITKAEEELVSFTGQRGVELSALGGRGAETLGAQRTAFAYGGAELGAGSPLLLMSETTRKAQEDVTYLQKWWGSAIAQKQAEISGYYEQLGILEQAGKEKSVTEEKKGPRRWFGEPPQTLLTARGKPLPSGLQYLRDRWG